MPLTPSGSELSVEPRKFHSGETPVKLYNLFLDKRNSTAGGDGYLTTETPNSGQSNESVLTDNLEFRTIDLLSEMSIGGRQASGGNTWEIPVSIYLRATAGSQGNTATYTFTLSIEDDVGSSQTIDTVQKEQSACSDLFGCGWNQEIVRLGWNGDQYKTISSGGALTLSISAESTCEGQGGSNPFGGGSRCDAEVMWGDPDDSDDYSQMEFWSNAASGSVVKVFEDGALWDDPELLSWYPNDLIDDRKMQFKIKAINAFGRQDIDQVGVQLRDPSGSYPVYHIFSNSELTEDAGVLVGSHSWTYPAGIESGEYELTLFITDQQGHTFIFEHEGIVVEKYGVDVRNGAGRDIEYIAPGMTTPISLVLRHTGADSSSIDVELAVLTSLDSSWLVTFDRPEGYTISDGGDEVTAQLNLEAPSELGNAPPRLDISVRAYNGSGAEVFFVSEQIVLEKLGVYSPPMLSLWDSSQENQIYNSTRSESFDVNESQFVDDLGPPTPFYIDLFNTGFDSDSFRFEVTEKPRGTVFYFVDNQTGQVIAQDTEDGLWHTPTLPRHATYTIVVYINPSSEPDDPDYGLMELEFSSAGNSSLSGIVQFTPHRTNGIQAEFTYDCDGDILGHVEYELCDDDDSDDYRDLRTRVKATQTSGDENVLVDWRVINPADYDRNADAEGGKYTLWDYIITDLSGDPMPVFNMSYGDTIEFNLEMHLTNQVYAGEHTIYIRIEEVTDDTNSQRFFDLPVIIEVGEGDPDLRIVQKSANQAMLPGDNTEYTMRLINDGNTEMMVELDATAPVGWTVVAENPETQSSVVLVPAFDEIIFTLKVSSASDARHGDLHTITVTGHPQSFSEGYSDDYNAERQVEIRIEINDPVTRISNELTNMRTSTMLMLAGFTLLIVAAIAGRKRRSDFWEEDEEEYYDENDEEFDLPEAVTESESEDDSEEEVEEDDNLDEIELID